MDREALKNHFQVLKLGTDASLKDVEDAYHSLKEQYAKEVAAGDGAPISLDLIDEAYTILSYHLKHSNARDDSRSKEKPDEKDKKKRTTESTMYTGALLKQIREEMDIQLEDISRTTKIPVTTLKNLEAERYQSLPPEVYVRGFLKGIAEILSLPADKVKRDYLDRYSSWRKKEDKGRSLNFRRG